MIKKLLLSISVSTLFGFAGAWIFQKTVPSNFSIIPENIPAEAVDYSERMALSGQADFVPASRKSTPTVVFIKTLSTATQSSYWDDWFSFDIFGRRGKVSSSGSGVILSEDGYIVTNNHVVEGAETIEVILNNNRYSYQAKVVGTDPSTDLALLKIEAKNLPAIQLANSDQVETGQWVLAVGNPFNLTSTVTAGIVSAKGRNINVVNNQFPIESFIQTDAAINPGNSGGALVNLEGKLVGINTAIASKTGAYNGYGFAIPSNIVAKIVKDLKEHGEVQRAFTGMDVVDITADILKRTGDQEKGVFVGFVATDGPAAKGGIKEGDVILKINGAEVNSKANFDEQIAYHRPGDKIQITLASGKEHSLLLVNREGTVSVLKRNAISSKILGAEFEKVSKVERDRYGIGGGIKVSNISNDGVIRRMNLQDGFIFLKLNGNSYEDVREFIKDLENIRGRIVIEGVYPNGSKQVLSFYYY